MSGILYYQGRPKEDPSTNSNTSARRSKIPGKSDAEVKMLTAIYGCLIRTSRPRHEVRKYDQKWHHGSIKFVGGIKTPLMDCEELQASWNGNPPGVSHIFKISAVSNVNNCQMSEGWAAKAFMVIAQLNFEEKQLGNSDQLLHISGIGQLKKYMI